jgi:large subunit ribosomal protein L23
MGSIVDSANKILKSPVLTEKATGVGSLGKGLVLEVSSKANKFEIKKAVEEVFGVKVDKVRTLNCVKRIKRRASSQLLSSKGSWKKAYISLKEGNALDIIEGL